MARGGRRTSNFLLADPNRIKRKLYRLNERKRVYTDIIDDFLLSKMPIHFGGMSDPFASPDIVERSTKILEIFDEIYYPILISTKNTVILTKDEVALLLLQMKNLALQISFSVFDKNISQILEPNVPSPAERLKHIKLLTNHDAYVIARIQPLIPNHLDEIKNILIPSLAEAGVKHVILEFLKIPVERKSGGSRELCVALNWDVFEYYKQMNGEKNGREWMLPANVKWDLLQPLIEEIHRFGMTYGAGDYGLNHLGDTDCCCGLDKIVGFSNWNKQNFSNWIRNSRTNVLLFDDEIRNIIPAKSIRMYINSNSRITGENTIYHYLKNKWNRPGTTNAPNSYLGVEWKGEFDEKGNCVYYKSF